MSTKDIDKGRKRILQTIAALKKKPRVKVGFLHEHAGKYEESDTTVIDVAIWNEFGTETIPERPFMRQTSDEITPKMSDLSRRLLNKYVAGRVSLERALDIMGMTVQTSFKSAINNWTSPPNAPSTILAKARKAGRKKIESDIRRRTKKGEDRQSAEDAVLSGYNNPLVDTGQMMNSVHYVKENL